MNTAEVPTVDRSGWGVLVDVADIPGGGHLHLVRHGVDYEILYGDEQLMGSWAFQSEEALATLVLDRLGTRAQRVLIGGLGMGFTLRAARTALPPAATIVVAELVPKVAEWAAGPLAHILGASLRDPRVTLEIKDVHDMIVEQPGGFDAILLDVDNGPEGLVNLANERLYCNWGLRAARSALRPDGVLAVWSAYPDDDFTARLAKAGFEVEVARVEAGGNDQGQPHTIWLATRLG
ncbi:spermidine synthase [Sphingomonas desiccabilis]|uniref:Spermidine synthase n=1 Tax=Sphingomonas desiccabilis TaxID=429134 RepID=A0A4Q2J0X7_9SPHN|nr:spermidine synthase [Sphingomonas desiccabilis]